MPRILLVDDDIAEISAVKRVLARSGHQPVLATNASDAMAALGQAPPDLLMVGSTCENGEALAMAARVAAGDAGIPPVPIVVLGEAPGIPAGAVVVPRPIDPAQLGQEVASALGSAPPREPPAPAKRTSSGPLGKIAPSKVSVPVPRPGPPPGDRPPRSSPPPRHDAPAAAPRAALSVEVTAALEPVGPRREDPAPPTARARAPQRPGVLVLPPPPAAPAPPPAAPVPAAGAAQPPADPGARRAAAAEALRARAEELRRGGARPSRPISEEVVDDELDALLDRVEERPASTLAAELAEELPELEPEPIAEPAPPPPPAPAPRPARLGPGPVTEAVRRQEEARRQAQEVARRQEEARRAEELRRAEAERAAEEARRLAAEAAEEARRAREAEARASSEARAATQGLAVSQSQAASEAEARRRLEEELDALRRQMEEERLAADERLARERERALVSTDAAEELSRLAEEQAAARALEEARTREEQEAELRQAVESARVDMEALRREHEEESRRRVEVEAELARLTAETSRRGTASTPPPTPQPLFYAFPEPPLEAPALDLAEDEARRRALGSARRAEAEWPDGAVAPDAPELPPQPPALPPPELRSGTLADLPAPRLLALAWKAKLSGRLDFQGAAARSVHFDDGRIVGATSAEPSERLEELALRLGLVTREQYRQVASAAAALPARRAALLLLERGFLKPNELTGLVRRRAEEILFGLFADESARFRWVGAEVPPEERVGLDRGPLALAVEGIRRRWHASRLEPVLGGDATLLTPAQGGPSPAELGLAAEERKVVALADGLRTLDELLAASPLDPLSTRQLLCALVLTGALTVRVLGAGRAAGLSAAAIDLARVREKLDQVRRADYFTILGVGRLCTPHEVREASERLLAEFAPARFVGVREDGLPERLDEILRVVSDAREVLADERLREEYLKGLGE